jgi:hypothetical protein
MGTLELLLHKPLLPSYSFLLMQINLLNYTTHLKSMLILEIQVNHILIELENSYPINCLIRQQTKI